MKVYCRQCRHFYQYQYEGITFPKLCRSKKHQVDTPLAIKCGNPEKINKRNNCKEYQTKVENEIVRWYPSHPVLILCSVIFVGAIIILILIFK